MRILFIAPRYHKNQHFIVETLIKRGNKVRFFALYESVTENHSAIKPEIFPYSVIFKTISWINGDASRLMSKFKMQFGFPGIIRLYKEIRGFKPDVLIAREFTNFSIIGILIAWTCGTKVLHYSQEPLCSPLHSSLRRKLIYKLASLTNKEIRHITPVRGYCEKYNPSPNTFFLPLIVNFPFNWDDKIYCIDGKIRILMVGKYIKRKNHILLLKALNILRKQYPLTLTIVASEEEGSNYGTYPEEVRSCVRDLGLESIVEEKINLSSTEMQKVYSTHDLFIMPSSNEPFAVSILEAMAHGLPVVSSNSGGASEYVRKGENGYIFEDGDLDDLVGKIKLIIYNKENIKIMGKASWEIARKQYGPDNYYDDFLNIIGEKKSS